MNLLGKILTVAIMIAAVLLVCVSVMVYATHKNWRTEAETLKQRLADQRSQNQQLQSVPKILFRIPTLLNASGSFGRMMHLQ